MLIAAIYYSLIFISLTRYAFEHYIDAIISPLHSPMPIYYLISYWFAQVNSASVCSLQSLQNSYYSNAALQLYSLSIFRRRD
jgi:hypothetical protein